MPSSRLRNQNIQILQALGGIRRALSLAPIYLGGSSGSQGGQGGPPGGFVGQLPQRYVTYDTDEFSSGSAPPANNRSLLSNLNRLRAWLTPARWFEANQNTSGPNMQVFVRAGVWWHSLTAAPLVYGGSLGPVHVAPSSNPRIDVVYLNTSGSLLVQQGSEAVSPSPTYPTGNVLPVWEVYLRPSSGSIYDYDHGSQGYLYRDIRPFLSSGSAASGGGEATPLSSALPEDVWSAGSAGTSGSAARSDHVHRGLFSIQTSGSEIGSPIYGAVTLVAGDNITLSQTSGSIVITSGSVGTSFVADYSQSDYAGGNIALGTATDASFVDVDSTNAAIAITPTSPGKYRAVFTFSDIFTALACITCFRVTDGVSNSGPVETGTDSEGGNSRFSGISVSCIFAWGDTTARTVKLQKRVVTASGITFHVLGADSLTERALHMEVYRIGS